MKHLVFTIILFLHPLAVTTSAMAQQTDSTEERAPASTDGHVVSVDARGDAGDSEAGSNSDENKRLMPDASENGDATATQKIDSKIPKRDDTKVEESAGPGKPDTISTDDKEEDKPKEKQNREQKRKKDKALPLEIEAKIHTRWEMTHYKEDVLRRDDLGSVVLDENGDPVLAKESVRYNEFKIQRARLKLTWTPADWVSARLQVGDFQEAGSAASLLKDAYLHLAPQTSGRDLKSRKIAGVKDF